MWLLTAVGSVHGQSSELFLDRDQVELVLTSMKEFTYALEQKKTYSVGRDRSCDIRFEGKYIRPRVGTITVGDWDPINVSYISYCCATA